jgi:hypothetical protein
MLKLFSISSNLPIIICAIFCVWHYRRFSQLLGNFALFVIFSGLISIIQLALWFFKINNLPLVHLYVSIGFYFMASFYQSILSGFINKAIFQWSIALLIIFSVINIIFFQPLFTYASYSLTAESILLIIYSLSTYVFMLDDILKKARKDMTISINWINSGVFTYYTSSLLIFFFGDIITTFSPSGTVHYAWALHGFFSLVMYSCFFIGLWHLPKI